MHSLFERLPRLVNAILLMVLSLFLLALYFTQRGHVEYLWLALHEILQAPIGFIDLAGSSARVDQLWYAALVLELVAMSAYLYFEFLIAFLSLRKRAGRLRLCAGRRLCWPASAQPCCCWEAMAGHRHDTRHRLLWEVCWVIGWFHLYLCHPDRGHHPAQF